MSEMTSHGIVNDLRCFAQGCRGAMWQSRDRTISLMDNAADEIERLRDALVAIKTSKEYSAGWDDGWDAAEAEMKPKMRQD